MVRETVPSHQQMYQSKAYKNLQPRNVRKNLVGPYTFVGVLVVGQLD